MKQSERFELIDRIARELQSRFKAYELDSYFRSFGIDVPSDVSPMNSKWVYAKTVLAGVPVSSVLRIAEDLNLDPSTVAANASLPPRNWASSSAFRLFVSHISVHKDKAVRLRTSLEPYSISAFVAHEDIHPTQQWEEEIVRALHTMDAFVAMHTKGFSTSVWTQQEIGFAVCRGVKIISIRMGEDPTGFLARRQALLRNQRTAEQIAAEIDRLLSEDSLTRGKLADAKSGSNHSLSEEIPF